LGASVLLGAPLLLGLGTSGGRSVINPAVDFRALLTDRDGVTVEVRQLNIGGEIQLEGDMGRGSLRIPFDNIQSIAFSPGGGDATRAEVQLKNHESVTLRVRNSLVIYGQTPVGIFQIRVRDLQSIQFLS
jgi:hypothetical protein